MAAIGRHKIQPFVKIFALPRRYRRGRERAVFTGHLFFLIISWRAVWILLLPDSGRGSYFSDNRNCAVSSHTH
jgi:hypothetical protein